MGFGSNPAGEMLDAVNSGIDVGEYQTEIKTAHNYLQKELFDQCFRSGIEAIAATEQPDARNERVVAEAQEICDTMGWDY